MELVASYPIVITDRLRECRDFYRGWFGFEVVFEADWIVVLSGAAGAPPTLAFMRSEHPSSPPTPAPYRGEGMFLTLQVEDARNEYERVVAAGLRCELELTDEPWGQRRRGDRPRWGMGRRGRADRAGRGLVGPLPGVRRELIGASKATPRAATLSIGRP
jgi:catechol 2,3-dioxygenase-like lactoylglutathione lyase family enzyme